MQRIIPLTLALAMLLQSTGCVLAKPAVKGSGSARTEAREVPKFTRLGVAGAFDVVVKIGQPQSVIISADDNLLPLIESKVSGQTLRIRSVEPISPKARMKIEIVVASLSQADLAGSGDVRLEGINEPSLKLSIAGSGDVVADGSAEELSTSIAGSGSFKLQNLAARTARIEIAGSGEVDVNASESLEVSIAGSGEVAYVGSPKVSKSIAGSGTIRKAN